MFIESKNILLKFLKIFIAGTIVFLAIKDGFCQIPLFKKNSIINFPVNQHNSGDSLVIDDMIFLLDRLSKTTGAFKQIRPWTNGIVYYDFGSKITDYTKDLFFESFNEWEKNTPIKFSKRISESNYILIIKSDQNSSYVGMIGGAQVLKIVSLHKGVIMHELGHALGLAHEHQRTDRNNFINILYDNIDPDKKSNFESMGGSILYTPYDFLSIMHYSRTAFSQNGQNTIEPKAEYRDYLNQIGQRNSLTMSNKEPIRQLYNQIPGLLSPHNGTKNVNPDGTIFSWSAIPGANQYQIHLSRDSSFTSDILERLVNSSKPNNSRISIQEELVSKFDPFNKYYWRIRSILAEGPGEWSDVFDFTTKSNKPKNYSLEPNYPNPFTLSTTIQFELKTTVFVEIKIFDIHGRKINQLTQKKYLRGIHRIKWSSENLPSGLYFCKFQAGNTVQITKLILYR